MGEVINIINILTNLLLYYISIQSKGNPSTIGPWTSLGIEYFDTEYYRKNSNASKIIGFPILQQQKLWTPAGIDLIKEGKQSNGYQEWFVQFAAMVNDLSLTYQTNDETMFNTYLYDKITEWIAVINYYNTVVETTFK